MIRNASLEDIERLGEDGDALYRICLSQWSDGVDEHTWSILGQTNDLDELSEMKDDVEDTLHYSDLLRDEAFDYYYVVVEKAKVLQSESLGDICIFYMPDDVLAIGPTK